MAAFQLRIKALLALTGAVVHVDDVLIEGITKWEHDKNVRIVMRKLAKVGMHVNVDKIKLRKKRVIILGMMCLPRNLV